MNQSTRKAAMEVLAGSGIAAAFAAFSFFRWRSSPSPETRFVTILCLMFLGISVVVDIARILYYRTDLAYFSGSGIAVVFAAFSFSQWRNSPSPETRFELVLWLILFGISVVVGIARVLYHRNHRDYFAEEMERRHSIAKGR